MASVFWVCLLERLHLKRVLIGQQLFNRISAQFDFESTEKWIRILAFWGTFIWLKMRSFGNDISQLCYCITLRMPGPYSQHLCSAFIWDRLQLSGSKAYCSSVNLLVYMRRRKLVWFGSERCAALLQSMMLMCNYEVTSVSSIVIYHCLYNIFTPEFGSVFSFSSWFCHHVCFWDICLYDRNWPKVNCSGVC